MPDIPRSVLSEQFEERMQGRRLVCAVFLTFKFDPSFFEQEVLPVFLNLPLSHAAAIKLVQLEDALRAVPGGISVYYDPNGLVAEAGPARLDVRRVPVRHWTGIFHAKNVFALVEAAEPDQDGYRESALFVASLSANLTRAGWWENVEVCHIEELREGDQTRLKESLLSFLEGLERRVGDKAADSGALRKIRAFLRSTEQRKKRTSDGILHTHFFDGRESVCEFIKSVAGNSLDGHYLEVISPYFDEGPELQPLKALIDQFAPKEVRVFLPRKETGEALCSSEAFEWVRSQPNVTWARLPKDLLKAGRSEDARPRFVHAKVYRFFAMAPKSEVLFVGSVNLTSPAHSTGGNLETAFLVELEPPRRPDWWLEPETSKPRSYDPQGEAEGTASTAGTRLAIRYWWNQSKAECYWDDTNASPALQVGWQGGELFALSPIVPRQWTPVEDGAGKALATVLKSTSLLTVTGDRPDACQLLVQEEGMSHRPSLLFDLTPSEILRYWSLLTVAQRAAFLEARAPAAVLMTGDSALVAPVRRLDHVDTFFDRFAGIFLAFSCLEASVRKALDEKNEREAVYRLFGQKYDSLASLLNRVAGERAEGDGDLVEQYLIAMCAEQLTREMKRRYPDFWAAHAGEQGLLMAALRVSGDLRQALIGREPSKMPAFLEWFDRWFLRRATSLPSEEQA